MTLNPPPYRGLSDEFLKALDHLIDDQHGGWWRDVLAQPDLILAVRRESLNVYYRGASLFRVAIKHGRPVPETHVKYLVRQRQALATLNDVGAFDLAPGEVVWQAYEGPQTLTEMMAAAAALAGPEKSGLHPLIQASSNVVDVEIALAGEIVSGETEELEAAEPLLASRHDDETVVPDKKVALTRQDRIDVASLETRADPTKAWLVFHEAKHFSNPALRAAPGKRPPVLAQMERYKASLQQNEVALRETYPFVCRALPRLDAMRRRVRATDPAWSNRPQPALNSIIADVAAGTRELVIEPVPRLIVFGFDADQRDGAWATLRQRLEEEHGTLVYAVGNPRGVKVTPAFQPSKEVLAKQAKLTAKEAIT